MAAPGLETRGPKLEDCGRWASRAGLHRTLGDDHRVQRGAAQQLIPGDEELDALKADYHG